MPKRSTSHVLESLSRDAFARLLHGPLGWVVRDIVEDYGIDVEVEIFDRDATATGLTFKAQLKGMEAPDHIGPFRDIKFDHLRYWGRLDVPVLLVAYVRETDRVYGRWIHELDVDVSSQNTTVRVRFEDEHLITPGDTRLRTTVEIVRRIRSGMFGRPFPVRLVGVTPAIFFAEVSSAGLDDFFRLEAEAFAFEIEVADKSTRVALPGNVASISLAYEDVEITQRSQCIDALAILAALFARMNRFGEALRICRPLARTSEALHVADVGLEIALAAYELGDHTLLVEILVAALERNRVVNTGIYFVTLRQIGGKDWLAGYRDVLDREVKEAVDRLSTQGDYRIAARLAYNFAQFLYHKEARHEARRWIKSALELDPAGYGARPEPYRLLGGVAWFDADMPSAVDSYEQAVALGGLEAAGSQLADSLMYAGRYAEARSIIAQVLSTDISNWRDVFVDAILDEIVEHLGVEFQDRTEAPATGTPLSGLSRKTLDAYLVTGDALNASVWAAICLEHSPVRVTTLMTGAFLTDIDTLMAAAVHQILHSIEPDDETWRDTLAALFKDNPVVRDILTSEDVPTCDAVERDFIDEIATRSFGLESPPPGLQMVDENNIVIELLES